MEQNSKQDKLQGGRQTDLAEGELETVEESLREHERKDDAQGRKPPKKEPEK